MAPETYGRGGVIPQGEVSMAKIMIECPDPNSPDLADIERQVAEKGCRVRYFQDAEALIESGQATSRRDAARQIAESTGEHPSAVETKIRRGEEEVRQPDADTDLVSPKGRRYTIHDKNMELNDLYERDKPRQDRMKEVAEILGVELPEDTFERGSTIKKVATNLMRQINMRGMEKQGGEITSFFSDHKGMRYSRDLCWRCLTNKPASRKDGLCNSCRGKEAQDKKTYKKYAKIKKRGIDPEATAAWQAIDENIARIYEEVQVLLEKDSPPRIECGLADQIIVKAKDLYNLIMTEDMQTIAYPHCYT
jgi:hypothetical protein